MDRNSIESLRGRLNSRDAGMTMESIAVGSGLTLSWLTKFKIGKIAEPRLRNYQALKNYLDRRDARAA